MRKSKGIIKAVKTLDPATFQPDHHTNLWIADRVMGWPVVSEKDSYAHYIGHGGVIIGDRPEIFRFGTIPDTFMPSSRIEDAVMVLRKMVELGWVYMIHGSPKDKTILVVFTKSETVESFATAETESLAICRAAGAAVIGEK